jgi:HK97 family phage major capsid protein
MAIEPFTNTWGQEEWTKSLLEALIRESALLNSPVTTIHTDAKVVHVPRLSVHPTADWTAELEELPSDAGTEDVLALVPRKIGNVILLSRESIEDASIDVLNSLGVGMARGLSHALDTTAFGVGAESATTPAGLLYDQTEAKVLTPDGEPTGVTIDSILDGVGKIEGYGGVANAVFLNAADATGIRKAKSENGAYLALPGGSLTGDISAPGVESIGGARFYVSPGIAAKTAIVADARFLQVAIRRDLSVDFSPQAAFAQDAVVARVTARLDWAVGDRNAIYYIKAK